MQLNLVSFWVRVSGPVHTNAFSFENAYFFIRFRLPSTLIRSKAEVYVCENGGFRKRSQEWRFLKTEVQRLCMDGQERRFSKTITSLALWTKNILSVFKKQKTEVFENALVWRGPQSPSGTPPP